MHTPEAVAEAFRTAWNNADADALTAVFTEDADFVNVVGFWWRGHKQIRHNHVIGFRDMFPDTTMVFEKTRVRMLADSRVAVVHARWIMTGQRVPDSTPGSPPAGPRRGVFIFVCAQQEDGRWLAVSGHNTDIINGVQTHLVTESNNIQAVHYRPIS